MLVHLARRAWKRRKIWLAIIFLAMVLVATIVLEIRPRDKHLIEPSTSHNE